MPKLRRLRPLANQLIPGQKLHVGLPVTAIVGCGHQATKLYRGPALLGPLESTLLGRLIAEIHVLDVCGCSRRVALHLQMLLSLRLLVASGGAVRMALLGFAATSQLTSTAAGGSALLKKQILGIGDRVPCRTRYLQRWTTVGACIVAGIHVITFHVRQGLDGVLGAVVHLTHFFSVGHILNVGERLLDIRCTNRQHALIQRHHVLPLFAALVVLDNGNFTNW
uniref:(northern house mosquito) hypothetical protein n=1 Tax=Culex pipiens TaxID=7175 RepID=A0A8D8AB18_CULPI